MTIVLFFFNTSFFLISFLATILFMTLLLFLYCKLSIELILDPAIRALMLFVTMQLIRIIFAHCSLHRFFDYCVFVHRCLAAVCRLVRRAHVFVLKYYLIAILNAKTGILAPRCYFLELGYGGIISL